MPTASADFARSGAVFVSDTRERWMTNRQYVPPKVWTWSADSDDPFASMNSPEAGPRYERELPVGKHPLQLYFLATPNGVKVTIMREELLERGIDDEIGRAHV